MNREKMIEEAATLFIRERLGSPHHIEMLTDFAIEQVKAERKRIAGALKVISDAHEFRGTYFELKVLKLMYELEAE